MIASITFAVLAHGAAASAVAQEPLPREEPGEQRSDNTDLTREQRLEALKAERSERLENAKRQREELLQKREAMRKDPEYRKRLAAERAAKRRAAPRREATNSRNTLHRMQRQVAIAENRHNQMLARMQVIREFAEAAGDAESVARADALLARESAQWKQEQARQAGRLRRQAEPRPGTRQGDNVERETRETRKTRLEAREDNDPELDRRAVPQHTNEGGR